MLHLTSCERIGKIGDPTKAEVINLRYYFAFADSVVPLEHIFACDKRHQEICIAALRIVSEL